MKLAAPKLLFLMTLFASVLQAATPPPAPLTADEAKDIAVEAYIYGYPLVTMEKTRQVMTNVEAPIGTKAPVGQFANARTFPTPAFKEVTAPNSDTLYSVAWLNLAQEPYVLHLPDEHGRYYFMPLLSGWTNVFHVPGTRTTGTDAQDYVITGPSWKGTLPDGVKEMKSPTNMVWILGRTYCAGTPDDYTAVHAIQNEYSLVPLSAYGKAYTAPKGTVDPSIDMQTPVRDQVNTMDAASYFTLLARLMQDNPPAPKDAPLLARLQKIGIVAGQAFDMSKFDPKIASAISTSPKLALDKIETQILHAGKIVNNWVMTLKTGQYGTDYLQRAALTMIGLGANLPQDAIYPFTSIDNTGNSFTGASKYVMHFARGQTPPVKGFWSLSMYDAGYYFVENPLNRYSLSPRNALKYNPDGSLDLYIQTESPGADKESNWLPAPKDAFNLMMRLYWSEEAILNGSWAPPVVQLVQ